MAIAVSTPSSSIDLKHIVPDFPEKWSAMVVKELRQGLRQPFFLWPFACMHFFVIASLAFEWRSVQGIGIGGVEAMFGVMAFWITGFAILGLITPWRAFDSLAQELENGNKELLMLSGLTRWNIVLGKCKVHMLLVILSTVSLLPYLLVRYFFGAFDLLQNLLCLLLLLSYCLATSAVVIGGSGFKALGPRVAFICIGLLYASIAAWAGLAICANNISGSNVFVSFNIIALEITFAALAMQVGRGALVVFRGAWAKPPRRSMVVWFIFSPAYLLLATMMCCGFGGLPAMLITVWGVSQFDKDMPLRPRGPNAFGGY